MKITHLLLVLALAALTGCESSKHGHSAAEAAISKADAERTALAQAPGGTIKEGELEKEHGRLIWSFDIAIPGSADIKEVQVDAQTGKLVSVQTETAADEAKETAKEKK
jgi:uncharacterized membrane protein YkoI